MEAYVIGYIFVVSSGGLRAPVAVINHYSLSLCWSLGDESVVVFGTLSLCECLRSP